MTSSKVYCYQESQIQLQVEDRAVYLLSFRKVTTI